MFCGVEAQDFLSLSRARVNGAEVFASLHLPDGRYLPVLFDGVISNLFRRLRRLFFDNLANLACFARYIIFILCHAYPKRLLSESICSRSICWNRDEFCHTRAPCVHLTAAWPSCAARGRA